jgi:hypothetical protein
MRMRNGNEYGFLRFAACALLCASLSVAPLVTWAHVISGQGIAVPQGSRVADLYQPYGFDAGAFTILPALTGGIALDDNVFATNADRQSDWAYLIRSELLARSKWSRHAVHAHAWVERKVYSRFSSEDQTNAGADLSGRVDVASDLTVQGQLKYARLHEDRGVAGSALFRFDRPVAFDAWSGAATVTKRFNRLWVAAGAAVDDLRYVTPTVAGVPADQGYRSGVIETFKGRVGYEVSPLTSVFVEAGLNRRRFEDPTYNSTGYRTVVGVLFEPSALTKGELYGGHMSQDYESIGFHKVSTWTYGGTLSWLVTPLTTISFDGARTATASDYAGGVSLIETAAGLRIEHELLRNLVLAAGVSYVVDQFLGTTREDAYWRPVFGVRYFFNRHLVAALDYRGIAFASDGAEIQNYVRNLFLLSLTARY